MKKMLSVVLTLALVLTLAPGLLAMAEAPRVLTIGSNLEFSRIFEYDAYKKAQEDLNIKIDFTYYPEDSFSAMLAGGDMADIMVVGETVNKAQILNNKLAMNLAPYLEEHAPNLLGKTYAQALELSRELMGGEEKGVYVICPTVGPHCWNGGTYMTQRGYVVNWEYYKSIGCPPINNDDEYIAVLKQMHEKHPVTEDGSPTYLMGVRSTMYFMGGFRACFRSDIALNPWTTPYQYYANIFTNELVNCYSDVERSSYWADMEFYNKVYRAGNFDVDVFTMTADEYAAKTNKGQYMGIYAAYNKGYVVVPSPGMVTYTNIMLPLGNCPGEISFIPANSENWELALEFINYIYDPDFVRLSYSGVQGKDWDYDANGVPSLTEESIAAIAAGDEYWTSNGNGYGQRYHAFSAYNPATLHPDGYPLNLAMKPDALRASQNEVMQDYCEVYNVDFWLDAFTKIGVKDFRNSAEQIGAAITEVPMDIQRILTTCNDILYTSMPMLVMAQSDEEFNAVRDEVLAEIEAAGQAEAWAWYQNAWEAPRELFNKLLAESVPAAGLELYPVE
jgi:putative aldouronate transport system substrate-binding protein